MSRSNRQQYERNETITDRNYVFNFGRYKGKDVDFVMALDCQYILYCQNNIDWINFHHTIIEEAEGVRDAAFENFTKGI